MAMPAATLKTAGMKKPAVNAAVTARAGITKVSDVMINQTHADRQGRFDITVAAASSEGGLQ